MRTITELSIVAVSVWFVREGTRMTEQGFLDLINNETVVPYDPSTEYYSECYRVLDDTTPSIEITTDLAVLDFSFHGVLDDPYTSSSVEHIVNGAGFMYTFDPDLGQYREVPGGDIRRIADMAFSRGDDLQGCNLLILVKAVFESSYNYEYGVEDFDEYVEVIGEITLGHLGQIEETLRFEKEDKERVD